MLLAMKLMIWRLFCCEDLGWVIAVDHLYCCQQSGEGEVCAEEVPQTSRSLALTGMATACCLLTAAR